jgi:hypothetical protein
MGLAKFSLVLLIGLVASVLVSGSVALTSK